MVQVFAGWRIEMPKTKCANEACDQLAKPPSRYCSAECEASAPKGASGERSIDGNQGEGNREADRRYREGATKFARSGRTAEAARKAADELEK